MKTNPLICALIASSTLLAMPALADQPATSPELTNLFGLHGGMTFKEIEALGAQKAEDHIYNLGKVPNPHPDFTHYETFFVDGVGSCAVKATFETKEVGPEGKLIVDKASRIIEALTKKYGAPSISKTYGLSTELAEKNDNKERPQIVMNVSMTRGWGINHEGEPVTKLADNLYAIDFYAFVPDDNSAGDIELTYYFNNIMACYEKINEAKAKILEEQVKEEEEDAAKQLEKDSAKSE